MAHRKCAVRRVYMDVHSANTPYVKNRRAFSVTSLHEQRSDSLAQRVKAWLRRPKKNHWIPAFAGMTSDDNTGAGFRLITRKNGLRQIDKVNSHS
jgi:hypothetical protein